MLSRKCGTSESTKRSKYKWVQKYSCKCAQMTCQSKYQRYSDEGSKLFQKKFSDQLDGGRGGRLSTLDSYYIKIDWVK